MPREASKCEDTGRGITAIDHPSFLMFSRSPAWKRGEAGSLIIADGLCRHVPRRSLPAPGHVLSLLGIREKVQKHASMTATVLTFSWDGGRGTDATF